MNSVELIIFIIIVTLFTSAVYKLYKDSQKTKAGLGCSGCRIADTCQKSQNIYRTK